MKEIIKEIGITQSSVVIDIGANTGQEIEQLLPTKCEIHSFEPHPLIYNILDEKYNSTPNLFLNNCAAWKSNGQMTLFYKNSKTNVNGGASLISSKENINTKLSSQVACIDIADYIYNLNKNVDLMKIDCEGAEYEILNHLFETKCYKRVKNIYYEDHSRSIPDLEWRKLKNLVLQKYKNSKITIKNWD
jgi:FkbM family methyltransferase